MRVHTGLDITQFESLLKADKRLGQDVEFTRLSHHGSRSHARAFDFKLGSQNRTSISGATRRRPNPGRGGEFLRTDGYALTYDEWGYFFAALFEADPDAMVPGVYEDRANFHYRTNHAYCNQEEHNRND